MTQRLAALLLLYIKLLKRGWTVAETAYPKKVLRLPQIISQQEFAAASDRTQNPKSLRTTASTSSSPSLSRRAARTTMASTRPAPNGIASIAGRASPSSPARSKKGPLVTVKGTLRYRDVEAGGQPKHRIAEIHATSLKRLSKVDATDDPHDGAGEE